MEYRLGLGLCQENSGVNKFRFSCRRWPAIWSEDGQGRAKRRGGFQNWCTNGVHRKRKLGEVERRAYDRRREFGARCLKSSRDFIVTFDEPMGIHTSLWCSMMPDFSEELRKDCFNSYWFTAFTRQGSQRDAIRGLAHGGVGGSQKASVSTKRTSSRSHSVSQACHCESSP